MPELRLNGNHTIFRLSKRLSPSVIRVKILDCLAIDSKTVTTEEDYDGCSLK